MGLKRKFKPHFLLGQFGRGGQWDCKSHGVGSIPTLTSVAVAQLVRASDCGSEGRGFDSPLSPHASVVKLVNTLGLRSSAKCLWVRVPPEVQMAP